MIKFDFYISAMSVSDMHGGGLTLHRIVKDDLNRIDYFFHVNRFGMDIPAAPEFLKRSVDLPTLWDSDKMRKTMGHTLSTKISRTSLMIKRHAKYAAAEIDKRFEAGKPLIALVCPQGPNSVLVINELRKLRPVSYITWVMDDHLLKYVKGEWQYPQYIEQVFAEHLQSARHIFVISPALQKFYKARFGVDSTILFGSADLLPESHEYIANIDKTIRIGYFGAVAAWQHDALLAVKKALEHYDAELHVFSGVQDFPDDLKSDKVLFKGRLPAGDVQKAMLQYDAVLLPISFTQQMRNMSQFNIATKMSEYLASGVPIMVVGPVYAAMVDYLAANHAAIIVTSASSRDIVAGIKKLRDQHAMNEILTNARKLVETEVGSTPMRERWLEIMGAQ